MKIHRLDLRAFGPFTGVELDLSAGCEGLHVIYGPNEAGKSTSLRALGQMLFGIPLRSTDDFVHHREDLRIGATLTTRDGRRIEFLRRKRNKNPLMAADDTTVLEDGALGPFLGSLDAELFSTMFGIDHDQLVRGGQEIVHGSGNVGQLLFAAGAGIADLQAVQDQLDKLAGELFRPRGSKQRVNQNLKALDEARKRIRQSQLPSEEWERHHAALHAARARRKELADQLLLQQTARNRLVRIRQGMGLIVRRKDMLRQLAELGEVRILPADFADRRRAAAEGLAVARGAAARAQEELQRIARDLQTLDQPEELLACSAEIERLPDLLGGYRKAQRDLPSLLARRDQAQRHAAALFAAVRPDLTAETADGLRLSSSQQLALQKLGKQREALQVRLQQARQEIEDAQRELADARQLAATLEEPRDVGPLKDAVRRTQNQGDLEAQLAEATAKLRRLEEQAAIALKKLPLWSGSLEELERLAVPPPETLDRFGPRLAAAEQLLARLDDEREQWLSRQADAERKLEQLQLEGEVPTEEDLAAARQLRDLGWRQVLAAWQQGPPPAEPLAEFLADWPAGVDLATAYPRSVQTADDVADRLRREANRVAQRARSLAEHRAADREMERNAERRQQAAAEREAIHQAWRDCWSPLGIEPLAPQEMHAWLLQQRAVVQQAEAIRGQRMAVEQLAERIARCRAALEAAGAGLGLQDGRGGRLPSDGDGGEDRQAKADPADGLADALRRSQSLLDRVAAATERRERVLRDIQRLEKVTADARIKLQRAESERTEWAAQWAAAIAPLGLPADTLPETADHVVAQLAEALARRRESTDLSERVEAIGHDAQQFRAVVEDLARRAAPEMAAEPVEPAAEELVARLRQACVDQHKRDELLRQHNRYQAEHHKAEQTISELSARLATLCLEASCQQWEDLPEAERVSREAIRLRENLAATDDQLATLSAGAAIEEFIAEAAATDADQLPGHIELLDEHIRGLEAERDEIQRTIGATEQQLAAMDAGGDAAEAAEQAQDLLARIEADAAQYVRLRLALAVLREGIERYRKKNEGPVLRRAGELFQRLTRGSFEGLFVDFDDQGQSVLKGVRPESGKRVDLAGMSDGTADQLHLALRLASLENYFRGKEPLPFIIDDVLIGFDDDRAATALEVLAEFSRQTQVIFFTHHAHLVDLARQRIAADTLFVHRLLR